MTIKGPFRFHAGYFHRFSQKVIDNWKRSRESTSFFGASNMTGEITLVVRLMDTGIISSIYVTERAGSMEMEYQLRHVLRMTSGIPPWDESMREEFGDYILVQLEFVYRNFL